MRGCQSRVRALGQPNLCTLPASGAITCAKITSSSSRSTTARAAPAAISCTRSLNSRTIGLSEDYGALSAKPPIQHGRRRIVLPLSAASHVPIATLCVGGPRSPSLCKCRKCRGPPPRIACARPPARPQGVYGNSVFLIGLGLRLYANRLAARMPYPLMNLWNATLKEKGALGPVEARDCCVWRMHALRLPLLRTGPPQTCCEQVCQEIAAHSVQTAEQRIIAIPPTDVHPSF